MKKIRVVIVDEDYDYLNVLQMRFFEIMTDNMELEIIDRRDYLNQMFETPQSIDLLIISENMVPEMLIKHSIKHGFILSESKEEHLKTTFYHVYKYSNINEIFSIIKQKAISLFNTTDLNINKTKIIVVTSASGGVGKTTIAMGIATNISCSMKKVLYINIDFLQNFQFYLDNKELITDNEIYLRLACRDKSVVNLAKTLIRNEKFDYLPPFKGPLISLGITHEDIVWLVDMLASSNEYEYIIVDTDSSLDTTKVSLLFLADKIVFVYTDLTYHKYSLEKMINCIDIPNDDRTILVCNRCNGNNKIQNNKFESSENKIVADEFVGELEDYTIMMENKFADIKEIQKLVLTID